MKLFEEFKLYEEMWEDKNEVCKSFLKEVNGKTYDLCKEDELRAAMEVTKSDRKAMFLRNIIYDGEAANFSDETVQMALRVWKEYKAAHNLKESCQPSSRAIIKVRTYLEDTLNWQMEDTEHEVSDYYAIAYDTSNSTIDTEDNEALSELCDYVRDNFNVELDWTDYDDPNFIKVYLRRCEY